MTKIPYSKRVTDGKCETEHRATKRSEVAMRRMGWIALGIVLAGFGGRPAWAASEMDLLLDLLVKKGVVNTEEAQGLRQEVAQTKEARTTELAKEVVPKWAQTITWSGDLRLRHESFWRDNSPARHRERSRLRLGMKAEVAEPLEAWVRLATGTNLDPISTNQSAQDIFDKKDLFIDQMYLKFTTEGLPALEPLPLTIWGGKFENPFVSTLLIWDGDLTPEGIAASLTPTVGPLALFATAGFFPLDELNSDAEDPLLFGSQLGATWAVAPESGEEWLQSLTVKGALAYYDYKNLKTGLDTSSSNRFGNTALGSSSATTTIFRYDYNELDLLGEIRSRLFGQPLALYADYVKNTAIAQDDEGYQLGVRLGKADKPLAWEAGYFWQRLESDAVVGQFTDSDFGDGGTNRKGHVFQAAMGTLKNSTVGFKFGMTESVTAKDSAVDRMQVDWVTKF